MSPPQLMLPLIVFIPFAVAVLALAIGRLAGWRTGILMVLAALASFVQLLAALRTGWDAPPLTFTHAWIPGLNVNLALRGDTFGLFFALLISGIGALVGAYSIAYMPRLTPSRLAQFYAALLAFMGAMLGVALADDLVLLFIFWEVTSLTSFLLIGFWYEQEPARKGAMTALLITALGGLTMMIGFIIVGNTTGTFSLSTLTQDPVLIRRLAESPLFLPALLLVLAGAMTKSAQWPFHFWLPGAMVAPTPVSTYLHAATMVKAGIFLLGRMLPIFGGTPAWAGVLVPIGLATFLLGAVQAFQENDLKGMLACATVSTLGMITMLYGLGAADQDALQIFSHATYKGALFLVAGIIEHATHTRDLRQLGGLRHRMPVTFGICLVGALSMAGLPPFFGFLAKEALYASLLNGSVANGWVPAWLIIGLAILANAFVFAVGCRIVIGIFLGPSTAHTEHAHEAGPGLWLPAGVLAGGALLLGVIAPVAGHLGHLVSRFSSESRAELHLSLLPTHLGPVVLSLITVALGVGIYVARAAFAHWRERIKLPTMQRLWDGLLEAVTAARRRPSASAGRAARCAGTWPAP